MQVANRARWYINRLRLMQPAEVCYRLCKQVQVTLERARAGGEPRLSQPSFRQFGKAWCEVFPAVDHAWAFAEINAAERILQGRWKIFALHDVPLGFPPNWNRDPLTGVQAPTVFGRSLDYRDESRVGNIKYLWEPSRHLELVTLAQAWRASGDRRFLDGATTLLVSWFEQCPFPWGVHWSSSLENAVRLVNWAVAWHLLGGAESALFDGESGQALLKCWLDQAYLHQRFIARHFSRHSSANNHLLGELMGLYIGSLTWPCWAESALWLDQSQAQFEREALCQNWEDGVNKEQGIYYHHEVVDMMLLCALFGRANGREFTASFWHRLEAMLDFLDATMDVGGHVPMFGDADDALMVRFDPRPEFDPFASLLYTGAELFGKPHWRRGVAQDPKTNWLLGLKASPEPVAQGHASLLTLIPQQAVTVRAFPLGGYWVMSAALGTPDEVRLVADAGPLGYLSIAAHGHADALSFVLSLGGREVLVDPGTFAYHTQKVWRDYFRGTSAHSTLRIDGRDQSEIGGNFMWLHKARAWCIACTHSDESADWLAEHDGYLRLDDPVAHRRRIEFRPAEGLIRVTDTVDCKRRHLLEWHWHLAPECTIDLKDAQALVGLGDWQLTVLAPEPQTPFELWRGEVNPPMGWVSRRFDHKQPSPTLRWARTTDGSGEFVTEFRFRRATDLEIATT
jgi:hypothetical protein